MPDVSSRLRLTYLVGWGAKVAAAVLALVNTRLMLQVGGTDGFAALSIALSMAPWLALLNLGMPGAVQNAVSHRRANNLDVDCYLQSASALSLWLMALSVLVAVGVAWPLHHWAFDDFSGVAASDLAWLLVCLLGGTFSAVYNQLLFALSRPLWPNLAPAIQAGITTLLLLQLQAAGDTTFRNLCLAYGLPLLLSLAVSAVQAGRWYPLRVRGDDVRETLRASRGFLLFSTASTATLSLDLLIMSRLLGAHDIATYALINRILSVLLGLHAVVLATNWAPLAELHARGEAADFFQRLRSVLGTGVVTTLLPGLAILALADHIVPILGGAALLPLNPSVLMLAAGYLAVRVWTDTFATAQLSTGGAGAMGMIVMLQMVVSITGQWFLGQRFGPAGIFGGLLASFLLTAAWILPIRLRQSFQHFVPRG